MSTQFQTYSSNSNNSPIAGPYTYPQYIPMRTSYTSPPVQNIYPVPPMFFPQNYSQAVPYMSQPVPLQACTPPLSSQFTPCLVSSPSVTSMANYSRNGSPNYGPTTRYHQPSPSPVPQSPAIVGIDTLGYSMGNLSIKVPSNSPPSCVPFVVTTNPMMPTPPPNAMMTSPPCQFLIPSPFAPSCSPFVGPTAQGPDLNGKPRARTRSRSPGRSVSRESESSESPAILPKAEVDTEPSKRDLVNAAFERLIQIFGEERFDQDGNRGENIVRLKVKTRNALEHIVPFIERCQKENLILTVSCPISTKKGRQQVRGFLAYLETRTAEDADRLEDLVREYNTEHKSVFNTWHRNPVSTWKKNEQ